MLYSDSMLHFFQFYFTLFPVAMQREKTIHSVWKQPLVTGVTTSKEVWRFFFVYLFVLCFLQCTNMIEIRMNNVVFRISAALY